MLLSIMDDARLSQFVLEECAESGTARFNIEDQMAAIAVQQGMSTLGSWISKHQWVGSGYRDRIRALKETIRNSEIKYDLEGPGQRNAFTKAAPRIAIKIEETPESRELADWYRGADRSSWSWSEQSGWELHSHSNS